MHYLQPQMLVALLITDVHEKKKKKKSGSNTIYSFSPQQINKANLWWYCREWLSLQGEQSS